MRQFPPNYFRYTGCPGHAKDTETVQSIAEHPASGSQIALRPVTVCRSGTSPETKCTKRAQNLEHRPLACADSSAIERCSIANSGYLQHKSGYDRLRHSAGNEFSQAGAPATGPFRTDVPSHSGEITPSGSCLAEAGSDASPWLLYLSRPRRQGVPPDRHNVILAIYPC